MGFKNSDLNPTQITPITPPGRGCAKKIFQVSRTDTTETVKAMLPASASITNIYAYEGTPSDAATSAAVTISINNNTGLVSTGSIDVKDTGPGNAIVGMNNLPNIESLPQEGDLRISAVFAAVGAATTGGPWKFVIDYVA